VKNIKSIDNLGVCAPKNRDPLPTIEIIKKCYHNMMSAVRVGTSCNNYL
jgi:hypothetical protein